jgi:hypothetical protein
MGGAIFFAISFQKSRRRFNERQGNVVADREGREGAWGDR